MSDKKIRHGHKSKNGKSFIILPIIFCLITYLVLYLAFVPSFSPVISAVGMFFSDNEKDYSTEYDNICLLYTSPSPRDISASRMPSSA